MNMASYVSRSVILIWSRVVVARWGYHLMAADNHCGEKMVSAQFPVETTEITTTGTQRDNGVNVNASFFL